MGPKFENFGEKSFNNPEAEKDEREVLPIQEDENSVAYLGVSLEKAKKDGEEKKTESSEPTPEGKLSGEFKEQIRVAKEIMGNREVMGPEEVEREFGIKLKPESIPPIPFSKEELKRAKELGLFLVLRADFAPDGKPLTMRKIYEITAPKLDGIDKGKVLYEVGWYGEEDFYTGGKDNKPVDFSMPKFGWALTSKDLIPNSTSKNYLQQTEEIAKYLEAEVFKGKEVPKEFKEAIDELNSKKTLLKKLLNEGDRSKYEPEISKLKLNKLTRQNPSEFLYDILIYFLNNNERLLSDKQVLTNATDSDGFRISLNGGDSEGSYVNGISDKESHSIMGSTISLKGSHLDI